jgi:hypothetical protein
MPGKGDATMQTLAVQWNHLPDIHDTRPLDGNDRACLSEIRDVLSKYGCLDRFGVSLLHKHFEVADDEILVESVYQKERKLVTQPMKLAALQTEMSSAIETQWQMTDGNASLVCVGRCFSGVPGAPNHVPQHTPG